MNRWVPAALVAVMPLVSMAARRSNGTAVFTGLDTTTQGSWSPRYGGAGYAIVGDVTNWPAYGTLTPSGHLSYTWDASATDGRALRRAGTGRIAATWFSSTAFDITVGLFDGQPHQLALYCLDYDQGGARSQRLDVFDAATNALLDSRTIGNFA